MMSRNEIAATARRMETARVHRSTRAARVALALAAVALVARFAPASEVVVSKPGAGKAPIALTDFRPDDEAGRLFLRTLANDLAQSGWFTVSDGKSGALALRGRGGESGGSVAVRCELVGGARTYFSRTFAEGSGKARRLAHVVADEIVMAVRGVPGIASTRIAMIGVQGKAKEVYVCDADGGDLIRLTDGNGICLSPAWWPDGTALAYTSFHRGYPDLYRIDLAANRRTTLASFPGINIGAAVSPDGREIAMALSRDGNPEIYVMRSADRGLKRLTRTPNAAEASPSWSPDGRRLVYVSDRTGRPQLYIMDRTAGTERRLTLRGTENVAPDWGPDGRIAFISRREGRYLLCVVHPDTGKEEQLTRGDADYEDPSWARNGRHIVCTRTAGYRSDLLVFDTLGDPPRRLLRHAGDWHSPAWSRR